MERRLTEKQLNEPLSPYLADAYNTLFSVVQGIAFGALFYVVSTLTVLTAALLAKALVVFLLISLLWHRYAVHNQYAAWHLEIQDTVIPVSFGGLQSVLALSIPSETTWFSFWLAAISLLGAFAYINTDWRYEKEETRKLFEEHYQGEQPDFSEALRTEIQRFHHRSKNLLFASATANAVLTVFTHLNHSISADAKGFITSAVAVSIIMYSFFFDLRWHLNHCDSSLVRKYRY